MLMKIVQLNENVVKGHLKEFVWNNVEETLNELFAQEAAQLTQVAQYKREILGHYNRNLTMTSGEVPLHIPRQNTMFGALSTAAKCLYGFRKR